VLALKNEERSILQEKNTLQQRCNLS
jgi:hypothetical protein